MGLKSRSGGNMTYLNVMFGKLVQRVNADTNGAIKRVNKRNADVYELHHDSFEGQLVEAMINKGEYGESIDLVFNDDGKSYKISIGLRTAYGRSFLFKTPNIDPTEVFSITPYSFEDKDTGKTISGVTIRQNGEKLENFWTKDKPGKLPALKEVELSGEKRWDDGDRIKFLKKAFDKVFGSLEPVAAPEPTPEPEMVKDDDDDMPF